jgi:probable rRNA maturation factor
MARDRRGDERAVIPSNAPAPPGGPRHLGDIALAHETCEREAIADGKSLDDHVAHLVIHGLLHLLGHDHTDDGEAEAMERTEIAALALIGIGDPYRDITA